MTYTRREFGQLTLAAVPVMNWIGNPSWAFQASNPAAKPNSNFGGVQIGAISYCFRQISYSPEDVLKGMLYLGLNCLEFEQSFFEHYLGAPPDSTGGGQPAGVGRVRAGGPFGDRSPNAPPPEQVPSRGLGAPGQPPDAGAGGGGRGAASAGDPAQAGAARGGGGQAGRGGAGGGGGAGRGTTTPEQQAAELKARADLKKWRMSPPWDKVKALRKMYDDAGVEIRIVKFPHLGAPEWSDEEINYAFDFARTMGARALTAEPPLSSTKRIAAFADRHKIVVGYHGHSAAQSVENFGRTGAWEQAFFYSKYNWANVDIGHFTAGNNFPPTEFIKEYHDRITNIHLKDRQTNTNGGGNLAWGQGDTPIKETLQLMKREKYTFPAMIELEYQIPAGSSVMDELVTCVTYCKNALV
jgi:sugar phosphate isomerase/epimerase